MYQPAVQPGGAPPPAAAAGSTPSQQQAVVQLYDASGHPVSLPSSRPPCHAYRSRQSIVCGSLLIITGVLAIVFNIAGIARIEMICFVGHGFWCSVMVIIAGAFGLAAARKNQCLIVAFMVLSIIASVFILTMFILSVIGAYVGHFTYQNKGPNRNKVGIMSACMAATSVVAGVSAVWGSVLACRAVCCATEQPVTTVVLGSQPVVVYTQQPQQGYVTLLQTDLFAPAAPPPYTSSSESQPFQQQQPAAAAQPHPAVYHDDIPLSKM